MSKRAGYALLVLMVFLGARCSRTGPPYSPEQSLKMAELPAGCRLELVASEPDVVDPVAIAFDEQARIYVVEMIDYPLNLTPLGQVKRLEDADGDGFYETSTVFAENIQFPNGVMRWRNGILVTSAPDILYFEDVDGDGKADKVRSCLRPLHLRLRHVDLLREWAALWARQLERHRGLLW